MSVVNETENFDAHAVAIGVFRRAGVEARQPLAFGQGAAAFWATANTFRFSREHTTPSFLEESPRPRPSAAPKGQDANGAPLAPAGVGSETVCAPAGSIALRSP